VDNTARTGENASDYYALLVKPEGQKKLEDNCLNNTDVLKRILKKCNFEALAVYVLII
jgi:hypothetical protein